MKVIELIQKQLSEKSALSIHSLSSNSTVLIIVDMVNGFAKSGNLYSDRIQSIIPTVVETVKGFNDYEKLFIADTHKENSTEFSTYPPHCVGEEAEIIEELKALYDTKTTVIPKNSTNTFMAPDFQKWFQANKSQYNQYVLIGDCTDICVLQLALSLKTYFNEYNLASRIIVPTRAVETYHLDINHHHGDLMNLFALYNMELNGVEIVKQLI